MRITRPSRERPGPAARRTRLVAVLVAGVLVTVVTPLGWWATHRPGGASASVILGRGAATSLAAAPATTSPSAPVTAPPSKQRITRTPSIAPAPPVRLVIPAIGVDASVLAVGVDDHGDMAIPERISQVGWYRWSSLPGGPSGSIVLAGHVDSAVQGLGALFRLRDITAGSSVAVTSTDGRTRTYRVIAREEFAKTRVPLAAIFSRTGSARLTIVTCGGRFDAAARSYEDNIVVTAVPA